jgi:hypothetical protein
MFFYQAVIMAAVVIAIIIFAFLFRFKRRNLLITIIIVLIAAGSAGVYAVQYYFGNHYYTQKISESSIEGISFSDAKKADIYAIFDDYSRIDGSAGSSDVLTKTYKINANGAESVIEASIYKFTNSNDADKYFSASQKFYENKNYIPLDTRNSHKEGTGERYIISFIKSQYKDYSDIIYLPSKITYASDIVIENDNIIIQLTETANRPVTNKESVLKDIKQKLSSYKR